ncbi:MAG: hypothetical protein M3292_03165 [Actinomycetota bacterium]|nr:hypothetical protein [Actinomycetota bacterium]
MKLGMFLTVAALAAVAAGALSTHAVAQEPTGILQICKAGLDQRTVGQNFTFGVGGQSYTVRAGTAQNPICTPPIELPVGTASVTEAPATGFTLVECHTLPAGRLMSFSAATRTAVVQIVTGGIATQTILICSNSGPLAAQLQSFTATRAGKAVTLRWRTASEVDMLGFNVYRQVAGKRVRLNRHLIPSAGLLSSALSGHSYAYRVAASTRAFAKARYWLQGVERDGSSAWYGPVVARQAT